MRQFYIPYEVYVYILIPHEIFVNISFEIFVIIYLMHKIGALLRTVFSEVFMNHYERLRHVREDRNLKQKDIAEILSTTQEQYWKYENGKQMMPIDRYIILAKYYDISLDYLTGIIDSPRTIDGKPYTAKSYVINQQGPVVNHFN